MGAEDLLRNALLDQAVQLHKLPHAPAEQPDALRLVPGRQDLPEAQVEADISRVAIRMRGAVDVLPVSGLPEDAPTAGVVRRADVSSVSLLAQHGWELLLLADGFHHLFIIQGNCQKQLILVDTRELAHPEAARRAFEEVHQLFQYHGLEVSPGDASRDLPVLYSLLCSGEDPAPHLFRPRHGSRPLRGVVRDLRREDEDEVPGTAVVHHVPPAQIYGPLVQVMIQGPPHGLQFGPGARSPEVSAREHCPST
mmetsp:Transcript_107328/g.256327  ORF Transcript_107328/g.256327 Transcript_107328/m.256327 type:complete len:252 (+) Transcript_107328:1623-2378(+)